MGLINFKAKMPKPFNTGAYAQAFGNSLDKVVKGVQAEFNKTTASWSHVPSWTQETKTNQSVVSFKVVTQDQIYDWVNSGTATGRGGQEYHIYPRFKKRLAYGIVFKEKTTPGIIGSGPGGRSGPYTIRNFTIHPGIRPRKFDVEVKKVWEPKFVDEMTAAMKRFVSLSGHQL